MLHNGFSVQIDAVSLVLDVFNHCNNPATMLIQLVDAIIVYSETSRLAVALECPTIMQIHTPEPIAAYHMPTGPLHVSIAREVPALQVFKMYKLMVLRNLSVVGRFLFVCVKSQ